MAEKKNTNGEAGDTQVGNSGVTGRDIADRYGYPSPSPIGPVFGGSYQSASTGGVSNPPMPDLDPNAKENASKTQMSPLADRIRNSTRSSYYRTKQSQAPSVSAYKASQVKGDFDITGVPFKLEDSHYRLNDGTWIPKYESFEPGVDNDARLAKGQGFGEKAVRGLGKFAYKTALYGIGGIVQPFYGIYSGVRQGKFNAVFNNDFVNFLDDLDKKGDYSLAHYYNQQERDMGFLKSMTTSNFWFNDFLGGLAFTAGAFVSAYATGGLGLAGGVGTAARLGMRAGGALGKATSVAKNSFGAYMRGARIGKKVGEIANVGAFLGTSTSFESSIEASSSMRESEANYIQSYKSAYGKTPSYDEVVKFRNDNANSANAIFAANVAILSLSNIVMFGDMFNVSLGVDKYIKKNVLGLGVEREVGKATIKEITPKMWQKIAGNTFNILKRPVTEGLYEEGLQGVASESAKGWVESRYNPMAIKENIGYMESIKDGFKNTYGTNQGRKEIGIGMIIGSMMGGRTIGGIREWSRDRASVKANVESYNKVGGDLTDSAIRTIRGSMALNGQLAEADPSPGGLLEGKFGDSVFNRLRYDSEMGLLDNTKENFKSVIESISDEDIASEEGLTIDKVGRYKSNIIAEFNSKVDDFTKANEFAKDVTSGLGNREFEAYVSGMMYNGLGASRKINDIAKRIDSLYGSGIGKALDTFSHMSPSASKAFTEMSNISNEIKRLESDILRLNTISGKESSLESSKKELESKTSLLAKRMEDQARAERELLMMVDSSFDVNNLYMDTNRRVISSDDIISANETIGRMERSIRAGDGNVSSSVMSLLDDYRNNLVALKTVNESMDRMRDGRFARSEERGFMKLLSGFYSKTYEEDNAKYDFINTTDPDGKELYHNDLMVDKAYADGKISEDEMYTFKTFNHMIARAVNTTAEPSPSGVVERYDDDVTDNMIAGDLYANDVITDIASKIWNGNEDYLSPNERRIRDAYKDRIDDIIETMGGNPLSRIRFLIDKANRLLKGNNIFDRNSNIIKDAIDMNYYGYDYDINAIISEYMDLANRMESGEPIDRNRMSDLMADIKGYSPYPLFEFVEQNRMIDNGALTVKDMTDYSRMEDLLNEKNPDESSLPRKELRAAQNPYMMTYKFSGKNTMEVSSLKLDSFVDRLTPSSKKESVNESTGRRVVTLTFDNIQGDNKTVVMSESSDHSRWSISRDDASRLYEATGIIMGEQTGLSTSTQMVVYRRDNDSNISPFITGVTFGSEDNQVSINQEALSMAKKGDKVSFSVDTNDSYTNMLYKEYSDVMSNPESTKEDKDAVTESLANNMVIKIMDKNGDFISVVKASNSRDKGDVKKMRSYILDLYLKAKADNIRDISVPFYGQVTSSLPGRPDFNVKYEDGDIGVDYMRVTERAADNILDIGYILNGEVVLKDGSEKYSSYPFSTVIKDMRNDDFTNIRIPVVVLKGNNGTNYLYPVQVRDSFSNAEASIVTRAREISDKIANGISIDINDIMELNTMAIRSGLDPSTHQIPMVGNIASISDKASEIAESITAGISSSIPGWMSDNRSVKEIAMDEVMININPEGSMFVGPKIRMSIIPTGEAMAIQESSPSDESVAQMDVFPGAGLLSSEEFSDLPFDDNSRSRARKAEVNNIVDNGDMSLADNNNKEKC